jgi:hypothetical protein
VKGNYLFKANNRCGISSRHVLRHSLPFHLQARLKQNVALSALSVLVDVERVFTCMFQFQDRLGRIATDDD